MKKNPSFLKTQAGFTLVELLVVIVIIATLAALSLTVGPRMMRRGDAAKSVQNMRQIGTLIAGYSVENYSRLPAPRADVPDGNGGYSQLHWHETLLAQAYPDTDKSKFMDIKWWESNKPFMRNPLCDKDSKPNPFAGWNPGYAMNLQIAENLGKSSGDWTAGKGGAQAVGIPLALIPDPARTPIVAPRGDWHFTYKPDQIKEVGLKDFLVDDKMPILFVDGHVETMALNDYDTRQLYNMPLKP